MQTIRNASLLSMFILLSVTLSSAQTSKKEGKYIIPANLGYVVEKQPSFSVGMVYDSVESHFTLTINNPGKNKLKISLQHGFDGELFRKEITDSLYRSRFNFTEAEDGEYLLIVNNGKEKLTKRILINTAMEVSRRQMVVE